MDECNVKVFTQVHMIETNSNDGAYHVYQH